MKTKRLKNIKWQISIVALIIFCFNLIPLPNNMIKAGTITQSPVLDGVNDTVTFYYENDSAKKVTIAGDLNGWDSAATPMEKNEEGIWTIKLDIPEDANSFTYKFVVDGNWIADPMNPETVGDGYGGVNSFVKFALVTKASAPILNADGTITFSYENNDVSSVSVAGDLNGWNAKATPLTKNEYGVWTTTFTPAEGTKQIIYKYVVDENWVADPMNPETVGDGYGGVNSIFFIGEPPVEEYKTVEFKYIRPDKNYDGWCLWTWSTGKKDGQVDFTIEDGVAVARFKVAKEATSVGFKVMKDEWSEVDYDSDRYIPVDKDMNITKVTVTSGKGDIFVVPAIKSAVIDNGVLQFKYRNKESYEASEQDKLKVQVELTPEGKTASLYNMEYDTVNEYFHYNYNNIPVGKYSFRYVITDAEGNVEYTDAENIEYAKKQINASATISPEKVNSDENTIVTLTLSGANADADSIRSIYMDLTEVGGPSSVEMSKTLLNNYVIRQVIGVTDSTTTGVKNIPITVVDINGEEHKTSATVTVEAKISTGSDLDFSFDEAVVYQVITDRYLNGNTSNDDPNGKGYDKEAAFTYHGGDFAGLTQKIDYLKDLGINTIWISPIVENTDLDQNPDLAGGQWSYHGYWAKNFEVLDPHFGTMEELKTLIDTAHNNGIKIMVDVVLNHSGYGTEDIFGDMLRAKEEAGEDDYTKPSTGLPDFRTEDPLVRAKLIQWQTDWLKKLTTDSGNTIDYFRIDTVKHVENDTWKEFKTKLTEIDPEFKVIGEYYGADINSDGSQLQTGQMDALLDFSYNNLAANFVNGKVADVSKSLDERASKITNTNLLGQFLSSHDEDGFITALDGDCDNEITDADRAKGLVATSLQLTDKGIPVIYYGEEVGISEKNSFDDGDPNRYDMDFTLVDSEIGSKTYNHYKKLLSIREEYSEVFAKGDRVTTLADDELGVTAFTRDYGDDSVLTFLNVTDKDVEISLDLSELIGLSLQDLYNDVNYKVDEDGILNIVVPAASNGGTAIFASDEVDFSDPETPVIPDDTNGGNSGSSNSSSNSDKPKTGESTTMTTILMISMLFVASASLTVVCSRKIKVNNK